MEVREYYKAVEEGNLAALIRSHQDTIDWRTGQLNDWEAKSWQKKDVQKSIAFNERAIELLKAKDIINYSLEYCKLEIPTAEGKEAFFIAGHKRYNPAQPVWCQSKMPPTTIHVVIGSEEDVMIWIKENADRLHGVYGQLEYQEQHQEWNDVKMVVI